jgi:hypothetical protein
LEEEAVCEEEEEEGQELSYGRRPHPRRRVWPEGKTVSEGLERKYMRTMGPEQAGTIIKQTDSLG